MSTPNPPPATATPKSAPPERREVRIISHCTLFYWWPVWLCGFIMFLTTWGFGDYMVTVPPKTAAVKAAFVDERGKPRDAYVLPVPDEKSKKTTFLPIDPDHPDQPAQPHLWMSHDKNLGVLFIAVLLLVVAITNIPLRGLWSYIVVGVIALLVILFAYLEVWDKILTWFSWLDIRINAAGYLVISVVLFTLWLFVLLFFDRQIYIVFRPGVMIVRLEIGGAETMMPTDGMSVEKERSDIFRHWILGLFSAGDLIVRPAGKPELHFPNVLLITSRVRKIEQMLMIKEVESTRR